MKLPFQRDVNGALARARADLAAAATELSKLAVRRQAVLLESDEISAVQAVDDSIAATQKTISILRDRVVVIEAECSRIDHAKREAERTAAIAEIEKAFKKRVAIAVELEESVKRMGDLWCQLLESREPSLASWPEMFPRPPADVLRSRQMERELSYALFSCAGTQWGVPRLPNPGNAGLGVSGVSIRGIAAVVDEEHKNILEHLRSRPIPEPGETEEAA